MKTKQELNKKKFEYKPSKLIQDYSQYVSEVTNNKERLQKIKNRILTPYEIRDIVELYQKGMEIEKIAAWYRLEIYKVEQVVEEVEKVILNKKDSMNVETKLSHINIARLVEKIKHMPEVVKQDNSIIKDKKEGENIIMSINKLKTPEDIQKLLEVKVKEYQLYNKPINFSVPQVGKLLNKHDTTVYKHLEKYKLPYNVTINGTKVMTLEMVIAYSDLLKSKGDKVNPVKEYIDELIAEGIIANVYDLKSNSIKVTSIEQNKEIKKSNENKSDKVIPNSNIAPKVEIEQKVKIEPKVEIESKIEIEQKLEVEKQKMDIVLNNLKESNIKDSLEDLGVNEMSFNIQLKCNNKDFSMESVILSIKARKNLELLEYLLNKDKNIILNQILESIVVTNGK